MNDHNVDHLNENDHNYSLERVQVCLRSHNSNVRGFVSFKNTTERIADVIWLNFTGERQSYTNQNDLGPGRRLDIQTFQGHPWITRDKETGDMLEFLDRGRGRPVYLPDGWDGRRDYRAPIVFIRVPVYSLYERSLQVVRKLLRNKDDVDELEIPKQIKYDIGHVKDTIPVL